jgi:hypothetical protein
MRTYLKFCFSVMAAGLLVVSMHANAAETSMNKEKHKNDPVIKCQLECKSIKDNADYESCMLKCKETHKDTNPVVPQKKM